MAAGRAEFGAIRVVWADAAASDLPPHAVLERLGAAQQNRYAALEGVRAQRFLLGRSLILELVDELMRDGEGIRDLALDATCTRCGGAHGRPRLSGAPVEVSVSYAGETVAAAAALRADVARLGVDIEREPADGPRAPIDSLAPLFAPADPPDTEHWTLIEAALKADGRGVAIDLADVVVGRPGSGRRPDSRAMRLPGRAEPLDAAVLAGPRGFVLSAAMDPQAERS